MAAQTGHKVTLVDVNNDVLKKAQSSIQTNLQRVAKKVYKDDPSAGEKFVSEALSNLSTSVDLKEAVKSTDLVVEAIVENMAVKHNLFSSIDKVILISLI